jgi:hypothetical protein
MATTPTYSWPIPDDTDLVKDGAEAIRDLGNAIDTTVDGLGVGLVHIETQTVSAVSSVNFNDVFSSTYNNYLINIQATSAAQSNMTLRLRAAGTDASAANYVTQRLTASNTTVTAARATGQTSLEISTSVSGGTFVNNFILANPFAAKNTFMNPFANARLLNDLDLSIWAGNHTLTTSYDGFSVLGSTSFSGTISVYGFKE